MELAELGHLRLGASPILVATLRRGPESVKIRCRVPVHAEGNVAVGSTRADPITLHSPLRLDVRKPRLSASSGRIVSSAHSRIKGETASVGANAHVSWATDLHRG
jgi:hypothetical protein